VAGGDDPKKELPRSSRPPPAVGSSKPPPPLGSSKPPPARTSTRPPPGPRYSSSSIKIPVINYDLVNAGRRVIETSLSVVPGDTVCVVVDRSRRELGDVLFEVTRSLGATASLILLEELGARPLRRVPDRLREELSRAQASVLLSGFEDGEHAMRVELLSLVKTYGLRHGHMVGITARSMIPGFSVDPARILDATRAVRTRLRPSSVFRVRSGAGTELEVKLDPRHRWIENLGVVRPGRWENLPSGKLTTSPAEVRGIFVADASVGEHFGAAAGLLMRAPVRVEIEASVCRAVRCPDRGLQREIELHLKKEHNGDRVGCITVGTNVGLLQATGEAICDLNLPGLHIAFGTTLPDQTGAAWSSRQQLALAGGGSDIDLDGAPLLRSGRYLIS
jgi:leucyl aminopeptidase (aminopeptidase T)